MKKVVATVLSIALYFSIVTISNAEERIAHYSDEYVSFDYIENVNCDITYLDMGDIFNYVCLTKMKKSDIHNISSSVKFYEIDEYEKRNDLQKGKWKDFYFSDLSNEYYDKKVITDGDNPEIQMFYKDGSGDIGYSKLIGFSKNDFAVASCVLNEDELPEESRLCKLIYDSLIVTDYYLDNGYIHDEQNTVGTIYRNVILSKQGLNYATEAINILEKYLSFAIDPKTASKDIEALKNRCENYSESSDYIYDSSIDNTLYVTSLSIDMGNDNTIIETIHELKVLADIE